ncbi:MAG: penicillin-insensitive murein endopeptidase [Bdellovibrionales bacterium]
MIKLIYALTLAFTLHAQDEVKNPFADPRAKPLPAPEGPRIYGTYDEGCIRGAVPIANSDSVAILKPSRQRYYGHEVMDKYLDQLGQSINGRLGVGDIGQADGGPAKSGHASHEIGLDVDIRYEILDRSSRLSLKESEERQAPKVAIHSFVTFPEKCMIGQPKCKNGNPVVLPQCQTYKLKSEMIQGKWNPRLTDLLKAAAQNEATDRIFVSPPIKRMLCEEFKNADWLKKIRPWYGHDDHFHVRLNCPASSPDCQSKKPIPVDSDDPGQVGCAGSESGLVWWTDENTAKNDSLVADEMNDLRHPGCDSDPAVIPKWQKQLKGLPPQCIALQAELEDFLKKENQPVDTFIAK